MGELLIILLLVLVLFGAGRLPGVMRDVGRSMKALREGLSSDTEDTEDAKK